MQQHSDEISCFKLPGWLGSFCVKLTCLLWPACTSRVLPHYKYMHVIQKLTISVDVMVVSSPAVERQFVYVYLLAGIAGIDLDAYVEEAVKKLMDNDKT